MIVMDAINARHDLSWHGLPARETARRAAGSSGTGDSSVGLRGMGDSPMCWESGALCVARLKHGRVARATTHMGESPMPRNLPDPKPRNHGLAARATLTTCFA